jgi:hypothetical protein
MSKQHDCSHVTLMMEAVWTSETSVNLHQATWHYNPEDSHLCTPHSENLKSQKQYKFLHNNVSRNASFKSLIVCLCATNLHAAFVWWSALSTLLLPPYLMTLQCWECTVTTESVVPYKSIKHELVHICEAEWHAPCLQQGTQQCPGSTKNLPGILSSTIAATPYHAHIDWQATAGVQFTGHLQMHGDLVFEHQIWKRQC